MRDLWKHAKRRRWMLVLLAVLVLVPLWFGRELRRRPLAPVPVTQEQRPGGVAEQSPIYGPPEPGPSTRDANPDRPAGMPLEIAPFPPPPSVTPPPPATVPVLPPPPPAEAAGTPPAESADSAGAAGSEAAVAVAEQALRPRWYVHPRVPAKILTRRKIDDVVLLQALVGADGRVREVRVVHGIPNCEECNQSAMEAAQQFVYDPPALSRGATAVWTQPFDMRFSYRR